MNKRSLDTEIIVLWKEHLEANDFSIRTYNILVCRLGLKTLGDILNLTYDDIARVRGAGTKTIHEVANLAKSCGYELKGYSSADPDSKKSRRSTFLHEARKHFFSLASEFDRMYYHPYNHPCVFPNKLCGESGWDIVKRAVFATYDVSDVAYLPDEKRDEVNKFAMAITDLLFNQLRDRAKKYKRSIF